MRISLPANPNNLTVKPPSAALAHLFARSNVVNGPNTALSPSVSSGSPTAPPLSPSFLSLLLARMRPGEKDCTTTKTVLGTRKPLSGISGLRCFCDAISTALISSRQQIETRFSAATLTRIIYIRAAEQREKMERDKLENTHPANPQ